MTSAAAAAVALTAAAAASARWNWWRPKKRGLPAHPADGQAHRHADDHSDQDLPVQSDGEKSSEELEHGRDPLKTKVQRFLRTLQEPQRSPANRRFT